MSVTCRFEVRFRGFAQTDSGKSMLYYAQLYVVSLLMYTDPCGLRVEEVIYGAMLH